MKIYIGGDPREQRALDAALNSLARVAPDLKAEVLDAEKLQAQGLFWRPIDHRGQDYDLVSNANQATRFAVTRFLVPILCQQGLALFTDCDVVFLRDPREMVFTTGRPDNGAVAVVKHAHPFKKDGVGAWKMVNQRQSIYPRKNWSSVMLFDCDHPANRRLSLRDVNERPGRDLHAFYWLHDDEITALAPRWNWLVDVQPPPEDVGIAHLTLGGPWLSGWQGGSFDGEWARLGAPL